MASLSRAAPGSGKKARAPTHQPRAAPVPSLVAAGSASKRAGAAVLDEPGVEQAAAPPPIVEPLLFAPPARQPVARVGGGPAESGRAAGHASGVRAVAKTDDARDELSFPALGVAPWLCDAVRALGITVPTPVQRACIPAALAGRDVIGAAQTGSGKTLAFALPILQALARELYGIFALVLTPTRELAEQIAEQFRVVGLSIGLRVAVVIGGVDMMAQALALGKRPHVVIATPGRLADHVLSNGLRLDKLRVLVLDEADQLMEPSFEPELATILQVTARTRQTLLFSATMTESIAALEELALTTPHKYAACDHPTTVATVTQEYVLVPARVRDACLVYLLEQIAPKSAIIFTARCYTAQLVRDYLEKLGIEATTLHSMLGQARRAASLGKFKSQQVRVLVATDVAARGIDIPSVDLVINYELPRLPASYVHRIGRTARAGRHGLAVSLVTEHDVRLVHEIEALTGVQLVTREGVVEDDMNARLNAVWAARRDAALLLEERDFDRTDAKARATAAADPGGTRKRKRKHDAAGPAAKRKTD